MWPSCRSLGSDQDAALGLLLELTTGSNITWVESYESCEATYFYVFHTHTH